MIEMGDFLLIFKILLFALSDNGSRAFVTSTVRRARAKSGTRGKSGESSLSRVSSLSRASYSRARQAPVAQAIRPFVPLFQFTTPP